MANLTQADWALIEQDYKNGMSKSEIANKYSIARQSVQDHFRSRPQFNHNGLFNISPSISPSPNQSPAVSLSPPLPLPPEQEAIKG